MPPTGVRIVPFCLSPQRQTVLAGHADTSATACQGNRVLDPWVVVYPWRFNGTTFKLNPPDMEESTLQAYGKSSSPLSAPLSTTRSALRAETMVRAPNCNESIAPPERARRNSGLIPVTVLPAVSPAVIYRSTSTLSATPAGIL